MPGQIANLRVRIATRFTPILAQVLCQTEHKSQLESVLSPPFITTLCNYYLTNSKHEPPMPVCDFPLYFVCISQMSLRGDPAQEHILDCSPATAYRYAPQHYLYPYR